MLQNSLRTSFVSHRVPRHKVASSTRRHKRFEESIREDNDALLSEEGSEYPITERVVQLFKANPRLGGMMIGAGMLLSFLGMMLFFERNLLRLGNLLIVFGIPLLVGPIRVKNFFWKQSRIQAGVITSLGILLVLSGRPRLGIICEFFGLLSLFGNMLPLLTAIPKKLPFVGDLLTALLESVDGDAVETLPRRFPDFG